MRDEILINVTPQETRASIVENGVLQEVHIERTENRGIVGNIYKGVGNHLEEIGRIEVQEANLIGQDSIRVVLKPTREQLIIAPTPND